MFRAETRPLGRQIVVAGSKIAFEARLRNTRAPGVFRRFIILTATHAHMHSVRRTPLMEPGKLSAQITQLIVHSTRSAEC